MKCKICEHEVHKLRILFVNGTKIEGCGHCTDTYSPSLYSTEKRWNESLKMNISPAHIKDIRSRRVDPVTKKTYRSTGKTYFCSTNTGGSK